MRTQPSNGEINTGDATPVQVAAALQKDYPEVEYAARANWSYDQLFNYNNKPLKVNTMAADESFLSMFTLDFSRPSDLESLLGTGIGFHLWHKTVLVFPAGTFQTGCKCREIVGKLESLKVEKRGFWG